MTESLETQKKLTSISAGFSILGPADDADADDVNDDVDTPSVRAQDVRRQIVQQC